MAGSEPLNLSQVKQFLRVDSDADDVLLSSMITQVRDLVEENLQRSIISQSIKLTTLDSYEVKLPYGPVGTVHTVQDADGNDLNYKLHGSTIRLDDPMLGGFVVNYDAGGTCPEGLKLGMLEVLMWLYENRGDVSKLDYMIYTNQNLSVYRQKIWI